MASHDLDYKPTMDRKASIEMIEHELKEEVPSEAQETGVRVETCFEGYTEEEVSCFSCGCMDRY
jgi:hypothetical protein